MWSQKTTCVPSFKTDITPKWFAEPNLRKKPRYGTDLGSYVWSIKAGRTKSCWFQQEIGLRLTKKLRLGSSKLRTVSFRSCKIWDLITSIFHWLMEDVLSTSFQKTLRIAVKFSFNAFQLFHFSYSISTKQSRNSEVGARKEVRKGAFCACFFLVFFCVFAPSEERLNHASSALNQLNLPVSATSQGFALEWPEKSTRFVKIRGDHDGR